MIRHIFKIIWNERKLNSWLVLEYIIVFCVLWFCCDYIYTMVDSYYAPSGFDIDHTYRIEMGEKPLNNEEGGLSESDKYAWAMTFIERVKRHPDVENVTLANASIPYGGSNWWSGYIINSDSVHNNTRERFVTSEFFDVFKMNIRKGRIFNWQDDADKDKIIISPIRNNLFGGIYKNDTPVPIEGVRELHYKHDWDAKKADYTVIGITDKIRDNYFEPYSSNAIHPLKKKDVNLSDNQIAIRVKPEADHDFAGRFSKEMREQLFIGPYYLSSVTSVKDMRTALAVDWGVTDKMNNAYAITLFLMINIFLGLLGSFWFRTQSRRSEIGLRIALGASKQKVKSMVIFETLFMLVIASVIGTIICLSLGKDEILVDLGIPFVFKDQWGIGAEQNIINFIVTFTFLAIVSVIAVWYPARQASSVQPAEALHDE